MRTADKSANKPKGAMLRAIDGGRAKTHSTGPLFEHEETPPAAEAAQSKYQILFEQASDAIITLSADGVIDDVNLAFQEMTGYHKSELAGVALSRLAPDADRMPSSQRARALDSAFFAAPGMYEDVAVLRKDGFVRYVELSVRQVSETGLSMGLFRDVTERKRMERELITKHTELRDAYVQLERKTIELQTMQETLVQSGKMAALGELAAGIAHEINQPLQGIRGYAQELQPLADALAKGRAPTAEESTLTALALREMVNGVDKVAKIISYMRAFVRKSTEDFQFSSVHGALEEALQMLGRQFASRGIKVERDFAADLPEIYANPLQLEQVFINLSTNARDAIEATGRGSGALRISTRSNGNFVEIRFKDDGCGMNERTKAKAFNPFFTTKEVGKGMGLGLSLSYGILSKLHGSIVVESELGKGAEFLVRLPKDFRELA